MFAMKLIVDISFEMSIADSIDSNEINMNHFYYCIKDIVIL